MQQKVSENFRGGVFPDQVTFEKVYAECTENAPQATDRVRNAYSALYDAFEEYLCAVEEHTFRYAYECGHRAAQEGGAV